MSLSGGSMDHQRRISDHKRLDKRLLKQSGYQRHYEEWFDYLRIAFDKEAVGHRYLRTLVLR
jgi:hypothetical protein